MTNMIRKQIIFWSIAVIMSTIGCDKLLFKQKGRDSRPFYLNMELINSLPI